MSWGRGVTTVLRGEPSEQKREVGGGLWRPDHVALCGPEEQSGFSSKSGEGPFGWFEWEMV